MLLAKCFAFFQVRIGRNYVQFSRSIVSLKILESAFYLRFAH